MQTIFKPKTSLALQPDNTKQFNQETCQKIYDQQKQKQANKIIFSLIDGPPYANGNIHLGHVVNKLQKDIFNQLNFMNGKQVVYVTGSDCHGLPIEKKVEMELKAEYKDPNFDIKKIDPVLIRDRCAKFAQNWIEIQNAEFSALGVFGDWKNHFATMDHATSILEKFHQFVKQGYVYKGVRPIMWSIAEQTSMATAEVEYKQHESTAIDVAFPVRSSDILPSDSFCVIWTTTTWTIPANRAIAYNPHLEYSLIEFDGEKILIASSLIEAFLKRAEKTDYALLKTYKGNELAGTICDHPLKHLGYTFPVPLLEGDHVTDLDGTGLVHTAPAHGEEDFHLGVKNGLEITDIVGPDGTFQNTPEFSGLSFKEATKAIAQALKPSLLSENTFSHSYPYSWRSHTPLIYRVTPQWYMKLEGLKKKVLDFSDNTKWLPENSKHRFDSMFADRGDWCLSRQRAWGVPVALFTQKTEIDGKMIDEPIFETEVLDQTLNYLKKHGVNSWWQASTDEILGNLAAKYQKVEKVFDILDVWFDAGSMQYCLQQSENQAHNEVAFPASMYLEGSDQHRGFFPACLIINALESDKTPAETILTHGFILDAKGRKMSKSLGNTVTPNEVLAYGLDVVRLWVALTDTTDDIKYSKAQMEKTTLIYKRFRNTIRYLLGCLDGFNATEKVPFEHWRVYEQCVYTKLLEYIDELKTTPEKHRHTYEKLYHFCDQDLSSFLLDINKDIIYCEKLDNPTRLSILSCYHSLAINLIKALTPVLKLTAQEAWEAAGNTNSVYLEEFSDETCSLDNSGIWEELNYIRDIANQAIESLRADQVINQTVQAKLEISINPEYLAKFATFDDLVETFRYITMTAEVKLIEDSKVQKASVKAFAFDGHKCARCRRYFTTLTTDQENNELCERCLIV